MYFFFDGVDGEVDAKAYIQLFLIFVAGVLCWPIIAIPVILYIIDQFI